MSGCIGRPGKAAQPEKRISDDRVEKLVYQGWDLKREIDACEVQLKEVKLELAQAARQRRGKLNTLRFGDAVGHTAIIRFTQSVNFDSKRLLDALLILKGRAFSKLFTQEVSYKATPELEKFLKARGNVAARHAIASATTVTDNAPKVTFEEKKAWGTSETERRNKWEDPIRTS